jgi:predicted lipoprotein with Yx(FWY)xxD motif
MAALRIATVLSAVATVLALASCSSSSPNDASVSLGSSRLGTILVNGHGRALYFYGRDKRGKSVCDGACARVWPPATVSGRPIAGSAVSAAMLGTIRRADHSLQLTYNDHPLYTFSGDTSSGQINGEGFLGEWFVVSPLGKKIVEPGVATPAAGY